MQCFEILFNFENEFDSDELHIKFTKSYVLLDKLSIHSEKKTCLYFATRKNNNNRVKPDYAVYNIFSPELSTQQVIVKIK